MKKILDYLSGKKVYLGAIALTIQAVVAYLGDNDLNALITKLIAAWIVGAGRAAVAKS